MCCVLVSYMSRFFLTLLSFSFLFGGIKPTMPIHSGAAILMDVETGTILYEKNGEKVCPPASITKLASMLYALQFGIDLDTKICVPKECLVSLPRKERKEKGTSIPAYLLQSDGTTIYINEGEYLTYRDLFHAHMLHSANDASNAIAYSLTKDIPKFVEGMNGYLKGIGCRNTHFMNPHGLFYPGHVSTPYDFAVIAREALKYPVVRAVVEKLEYTIGKTNRSPPRCLQQKNFLQRPNSKYYYEYAKGLKTGVNDEALFTLVSVAEREGRELIVVIFQSPTYKERFQDAITLFEAGFSEQKVTRTLFNAGTIFYSTEVKGVKKRVKGAIHSDANSTYYPSLEPELEAVVEWQRVNLPIRKGDEIGLLHVKRGDGEVIDSIPIFSEEAIKSLFWKRFFIVLGVILLLSIFYWAFCKSRKCFNR